MGKLIDLTGKVFGRLTVEGKSGEVKGRQPTWQCSCTCGARPKVLGQSLRNGITVSCGCYHHEKFSEMLTKHGHSSRSALSTTYVIWKNMWQRATNPRHPSYKDYGAKGVQVCDRWSDFRNFLADMGERPEGLSLEREDVTKDYDPTNCVWATWVVQNNNKRKTRRYLIDGEGHTKAELGRMWGLRLPAVNRRLRSLGLLPPVKNKPRELKGQ